MEALKCRERVSGWIKGLSHNSLMGVWGEFKRQLPPLCKGTEKLASSKFP